MKRTFFLVACTALALISLAVPTSRLAAAAPPASGEYTGILLDASTLPLLRSPSPTIYGPQDLIYPDRTHVPTPDQVQDESIVRYYRTLDAAKTGVGGSNPLILHPLKVVGPAHDGLVLSAEDSQKFQDLDKKIHFSDTWQVGELVAADQ